MGAETITMIGENTKVPVEAEVEDQIIVNQEGNKLSVILFSSKSPTK